MPNAVDVSKQRFGRLVALYPIESMPSVLWSCKCDCGNIVELRVSELRSGNTSSCGCIRHENLIGRVFGRLTVMSSTGKKTASGKYTWKCKCLCGNETEVTTGNLTSKNTKSCGCLNMDNITTHGLSKTLGYKNSITMRYRARKVNATIEEFTSEDIQKKMIDWGNKCIYCGEPYEHTDHLIPLNRGGSHSLSNLVPSCGSCNQSKRDRYLGTEWWPKSWGANI